MTATTSNSNNTGVATLLQLFMGLASTDELQVEDNYYKIKDFLSRPGNSQFVVSNEVLHFQLFAFSYIYQVAPFLQAGIRHPDPLIRALTVHELAVSVNTVPHALEFLVRVFGHYSVINYISEI